MLIYDTWCDGIRSRLLVAGVAGVSVTEHRETPTRDEQLPTCDIFIAGDEARPTAGSGRTGLPQFEHVTKLGIEIRDVSNDGSTLRRTLHERSQRVLDALLPTWPEWLVDGEGIGGLMVMFDVPPDAGEVTGRVQISIDLLWQSQWSIAISEDIDALETVGLDTGIPAGETTIGGTIPLPQP